MTLHGDPRTLAALRRSLKKLPITASARIAQRYAPEATALARAAFDAGQTVYGEPRPRSVDGGPLTLRRTGATEDALRFIATGRDVRVSKFPTYVRYLIGKYRVLPNGRLPTEWRERLTDIAVQALYDALHRPDAGTP